MIASEGKFAPTAKKVVERPREGNTHYIGYGHNIPPTSEYMSKNITENEARQLLISDLTKKRIAAKSVFEKTVGEGKFDKLTRH